MNQALQACQPLPATFWEEANLSGSKGSPGLEAPGPRGLDKIVWKVSSFLSSEESYVALCCLETFTNYKV